MRSSRGFLDELRGAVVQGDVWKAREMAIKAAEQGVAPNDALEELVSAMREVDEKFERKDFFVIDVAASASAMREAFRVFEPQLQTSEAKVKGTIVIGSLKGNVQSIGKDIVAAMMRAARLRVVDVGVDVPSKVFVETAIHEDAGIIAISVSMRETVPLLKEVVDLIELKGIYGKTKILIGGQAVSERTCEEYGVDAYGKDAREGVEKAEALLSA